MAGRQSMPMAGISLRPDAGHSQADKALTVPNQESPAHGHGPDGRPYRSSSAPGLPPIPQGEAAEFQGEDAERHGVTPQGSNGIPDVDKLGAAGHSRRRSASSLPSGSVPGRSSPGVGRGRLLSGEGASTGGGVGPKPPVHQSHQGAGRDTGLVVGIETYDSKRSPGPGSKGSSSTGSESTESTSPGTHVSNYPSGGTIAVPATSRTAGDPSRGSNGSNGMLRDITDLEDDDRSSNIEASMLDTSGISIPASSALDHSRGAGRVQSQPDRTGPLASARTRDGLPPLETLPETRERSASTLVHQETMQREWQRTVDGNSAAARISKEANEAHEKAREALAEQQRNSGLPSVGFTSGTTIESESGSSSSGRTGLKRSSSSASTLTDLRESHRTAAKAISSPLAKNSHSKSFAGSKMPLESPSGLGAGEFEDETPSTRLPAGEEALRNRAYMGRRSSEGSVLGLLGSSRGRRQQFREAREAVAESGGMPSALLRGTAAEDDAVIEAAGTSSNAYDAMADLITKGQVRKGRRGSLFDNESVLSKPSGADNASTSDCVQPTARRSVRSQGSDDLPPRLGVASASSNSQQGSFMSMPRSASEGVSTLGSFSRIQSQSTMSSNTTEANVNPQTKELLRSMLSGLLDKVRDTPAPLRKNDKLKLGNVRVRLAAMKYLPKEVQKRFQSSVRKNRKQRRKRKAEISQQVSQLRDAVVRLAREQRDTQAASQVGGAEQSAGHDDKGGGGGRPLAPTTTFLGAGSSRGFTPSGEVEGSREGEWQGAAGAGSGVHPSPRVPAAATSGSQSDSEHSHSQPDGRSNSGDVIRGMNPASAKFQRPRVTFLPAVGRRGSRRGSVGQVEQDGSAGLLGEDDDADEAFAIPARPPPHTSPRRASPANTNRGILKSPLSGGDPHGNTRSRRNSGSGSESGTPREGRTSSRSTSPSTSSPRQPNGQSSHHTSQVVHPSPRNMETLRSVVAHEVGLLQQAQTVALADVRKSIRH